MQQDNNMPDMLSIMMQMLNNSDDSENNEQTAKMQQAMHTMQMFQTLNALNQPSNADEDTNPAEDTPKPASSAKHSQPHSGANTSFYDTPILTPELITIKSALPHIERRYQKPLGLLVKFVELQRLMKHYESDTDVQVQSACDNHTAFTEHTRNMFSAIHANTADEISRTKIDTLMKALDIAELLQKIPFQHT